MSISRFVKITLVPVDVGSGPFNVSPQVYQLGLCRRLLRIFDKIMDILFMQMGVRGS